MDGVGWGSSTEYNALKNANTPDLVNFFKNRPFTTLNCHGKAVGLPEGVMGNSEVGHLNIGAGRVVMQDLVRIDTSFEKNNFKDILEFKNLIKYVKENNKALHLVGLLSDAGVHSDYNHLKNILKILKGKNVYNVYIHAITDGRDTPPNSGIKYLVDIMDFMNTEGIGKLGTIIGRYYCMDRDTRWERIKVAYDCLTKGEGIHTKDPLETVQEMYKENITDEFFKPIIIDYIDGNNILKDKDAVLTLNFRADRMREIAAALNFDDFDGFHRDTIVNLFYTTMTKYQEAFPFPVLFKDEHLKNILGEVLSAHGITQLRIAETEKYAHVTYFFNGGEEKKLIGEDRILILSPKVATYDLQPEMNAPKVTEKLIEAIEKNLYDVIILNFANGDMVGHTGVYEAAIKALENIDLQIGKLVNLFTMKGGTVLITADHGNAEEMWDFTNEQPHTQHTLNPVPFVIITPNNKPMKLRDRGSLADIAPTVLEILNIPKPNEMTGESLIR